MSFLVAGGTRIHVNGHNILVGGGSPTPTDTTPPSAPTDLTGVYDGLKVTLTWTGSTDDSGLVLGYYIYRDGVRVGQALLTTTANVLVTPGTYTFTVTAVDATLNESDPSDGFELTVSDEADTTAPSVPENLSATFDSGTNEVTITWDASTDDRGVVGYWLFVNDQPLIFGNALTFTYELTASGTYEYKVLAYDAANNQSALSTGDSVTVTIAPPPDTTPPTQPTNMAATILGNDIRLSWTSSQDPGGSGVVVYVLYKDSNPYQFVFPPDHSYVDVAPTVGAHHYWVQAVDAAGNWSTASLTVNATIVSGYSPSDTLATDDTTDVSAAMAAFFATVPKTGATVNFKTGAVYHMEKTLTLTRYHDLTINFNGATFHAHDWDGGDFLPDGDGRNPYRTRSQLKLENCTNTVLNNPRMIGAQTHWATSGLSAHVYTYIDNGVEKQYNVLQKPRVGLSLISTTFNSDLSQWDAYQIELEAQHGIHISGGQNITINNGKITDVFGDFVAVERGSGNNIPDHITIDGLVGRRNGRQGVALVCGTNLVVKNVDFDSCRRAFIDVEPGNRDDDFINGVTIRNTTCGFHLLNWVSAAGQGHVDNVTITDNRGVNSKCNVFCQSNTASFRRSNWTVTDNIATGKAAGSNVHTFTNVDGLTVTGNTQPVSTTQIMYYCDVTNCTDVTVSGNTITNVQTGNPLWPGGDGQVRYKNSSGTVLGYSPDFPAP